MLSKSQIAFIKSLQVKKYRSQHKLFVAEGNKNITDMLESPLRAQAIYTTTPGVYMHTVAPNIKVFEVTAAQLKQISGLTTPQDSVALFEIPAVGLPTAFTGYVLVLDDIQDPGNLGTILRTASWFNIKHVLCSRGTADAFAPKVVQATMGTLGNLAVHYADLEKAVKDYGLPVVGLVLDGINLFTANMPEQAFIVIGNEGRGIGDWMERQLTHRLTIPRAGTGESLNAAVAAGIVMATLRMQG